jgi:hypothetical protein
MKPNWFAMPTPPRTSGLSQSLHCSCACAAETRSAHPRSLLQLRRTWSHLLRAVPVLFSHHWPSTCSRVVRFLARAHACGIELSRPLAKHFRSHSRTCRFNSARTSGFCISAALSICCDAIRAGLPPPPVLRCALNPRRVASALTSVWMKGARRAWLLRARRIRSPPSLAASPSGSPLLVHLTSERARVHPSRPPPVRCISRAPFASHHLDIQHSNEFDHAFFTLGTIGMRSTACMFSGVTSLMRDNPQAWLRFPRGRHFVEHLNCVLIRSPRSRISRRSFPPQLLLCAPSLCPRCCSTTHALPAHAPAPAPALPAPAFCSGRLVPVPPVRSSSHAPHQPCASALLQRYPLQCSAPAAQRQSRQCAPAPARRTSPAPRPRFSAARHQLPRSEPARAARLRVARPRSAFAHPNASRCLRPRARLLAPRATARAAPAEPPQPPEPAPSRSRARCSPALAPSARAACCGRPPAPALAPPCRRRQQLLARAR